MKRLYIFMFICFSSFFNPISGIEQISNSGSEPLLSSQNIPQKEEKIVVLAAMLNDMAFSTLIYTMHTLEDNLEYWQEQLKNSRTYATIRNPQAWFTTKSTIKDHIKALKNIEQIHAKALGNMHILKHAKQIPADEYCAKSLEILATLIKVPSAVENDNVEERLSAAINEISSYKKAFDHTISAHTKPSHLARNWWKYMLGAAAISALGITAYEYKENISQGYQQGLEALQRQWQKRVIETVKGIISNLSLESYKTSQKSMEEILQAINQKDIDISNIKEALNEKEKGFESDLRKYIGKKPYISKHMADNLTTRIMNNNDSSLTNDIAEQINNFTFSNLFKSLFRNIFPSLRQNLHPFHPIESIKIGGKFCKLKIDKGEYEMHKLVLQLLKILYQVREQLYLQEVNIMLLTMFPAALTLYASYKTSTYAFSTLFFRKVVLIPLQERILSIRKMLNRFDDGQQKELSAEMTGHLVYWAHKLRQYIIQIPDEQQKSFKQDIQELESMQLIIKQKHEVVKRMYDVYGFLKVSE